MIVGEVHETEHVKFISYSGTYPNLCSGELVLEIDGQECRFYFLNCEHEEDGVFYGTSFWCSGGGIKSDYTETYSGEWRININEIPEKFRKYAYEIDGIFNENVEYGCCGGCI